MLLRFSFFKKSYEGVLAFRGSRAYYKDYFMPDAGPFEKSFGVDPLKPKTLTLWNAEAWAQDVRICFLPNVSVASFGDFARVAVLRYRPSDLRIQTLGLMPYRARVTAPEAVYLETPRLFIPGYRAQVDGKSAPVEASPDHLAMVELAPGTHEVEVAYHPTLKLGVCFWLSAAGWAAVLAWLARRISRNTDSAAAESHVASATQ